ncbi:FKBP-type peptidyl-prolyl cis-trans isomerases 2 [Hahella chejuensis KCTC 2396]|uniref:Peptidyl-prolyl cis-trans isomerase n=1 Tax=Hahella chejuensis (strain KCTC 2396) TaxID=349521 RepID=Q2SL75_HAHCH|nr:peptidylprolyl isomerase [Hahella chejuensis]ABC28599.1 FKBP-type peptidyl-prolyl cis-trans isomerases 2 [Hahella chejuensis KCTC 2396]
MRPKVFTVDYKLKNAEGEVVDTSFGGEPLVFMQGAGQVTPGFEQGLAEHVAGDEVSLSIPPELAYGHLKEELMQMVPANQFEGVDELKPGMLFQTQSGDERRVIKVVSIHGEKVLVDANHPLAGLTLYFEVHVRSVREATDDEIKSGYAVG